MKALKDIVSQCIARHSKQVRTITQPLHDCLGVNYFTYHKITNDGRYIVLVDRPEWAEYYVDNKFYEIDPFLHHPDHYKSGITSWRNHGAKDYQEKVIGDASNKFDMKQGVVLVEQVSDGIEFFGFTSSSRNNRLSDVVANDLELFRTFGSYFKNEMTSILNRVEEKAVFLKDLRGKSFLKDPKLYHSVTDTQRMKILQQLGLGDLVEKAQKLSMREKECLVHLLTNKTMQEIADCTVISSRTVEHYLENTKNKLSVLTRKELFEIAQKLQELRLIS